MRWSRITTIAVGTVVVLSGAAAVSVAGTRPTDDPRDVTVGTPDDATAATADDGTADQGRGDAPAGPSPTTIPTPPSGTIASGAPGVSGRNGADDLGVDDHGSGLEPGDDTGSALEPGDDHGGSGAR